MRAIVPNGYDDLIERCLSLSPTDTDPTEALVIELVTGWMGEELRSARLLRARVRAQIEAIVDQIDHLQFL